MVESSGGHLRKYLPNPHIASLLDPSNPETTTSDHDIVTKSPQEVEIDQEIHRDCFLKSLILRYLEIFIINLNTVV